ncbi:MAG: hypothetical protein EAX95_09425 [Candidatus Thorarchaeota archaeon]|nr:hypothetical protein [Candidatus Thorarchaeota archaeon]
MTTDDDCDYLSIDPSGHNCKLRKLRLHKLEVETKCIVPDLSVICVDAYTSLNKGLDAVKLNSTEAFLWLVDTANHFENLKEYDNAIAATRKGIDLAVKMNLVEKAYEIFRYARTIYENGLAKEDPSLQNPSIKASLVKTGMSLIQKARELTIGSPVADVQAELKASVLGGVTLKKAEKEAAAEEKSKIVISHGHSLYTKKAEEYKEGAETYLKSGLVNNAITFSCLGALSDLMLGKPTEGLVYLTKFLESSGEREKFNDHTCFKWTRLVFRGLVSRDAEALEQAQVLFLQIPWSFKDDKEFGRRVMESVQRRISDSEP